MRQTIPKTSASPLILTLDAGGTNFVFSAVRNGEIVGESVTLPSMANDLEACLDQIIGGLQEIHNSTGREAAAISIGFPGPADYKLGIIGECNNLPAFRGDGVALGPMLEHHFDLPVFIRNDADLFAYGEALAGALPEINGALEESGSTLRYRNLLGITLGTGLGAGMVSNGQAARGGQLGGGGDMGAAEQVAPGFSGRRRREYSRAEAGVRGDCAHAAGGSAGAGGAGGDRASRPEGPQRGGAGIVSDALVKRWAMRSPTRSRCSTAWWCMGGGISAAHDLFMPAVMQELNAQYQPRDGAQAPRTLMRAFNLEDETDRRSLLAHKTRDIAVPRTDRHGDL